MSPVATDHSLLFGCGSLKQVELGFSPQQAVCSGLNRAALLRDSLTQKGCVFFKKIFSPPRLFIERETTLVFDSVKAPR